jgi:hypothetical protein
MNIQNNFKDWLTIALSAFALINPAFAADFLVPGIYRLEAGSHLSAAKKIFKTSDEEYVERFEHAIPESARVTYGVVSHDPDSDLNKLIFLVDKDYEFDRNSKNKLCPAYAFPQWNEYSVSQPFCRTNIGNNEYEAALTWTTAAFTVSWKPKKEFLRDEYVPPQRPPTPEETGTCALGVCPQTAYGRTTGLYEVTHYTDRFTLETVRPYRDIIYLRKTMPIYTQADRNSASSDIEAKSYVAVLAISPEWYEVDRVSRDGIGTHGWINRDDVFDVKWITQKAETKDFRFRVAFHPGEDASESSGPVAIEVIDRKTDKRVQVIRDFYSDPRFVAADNEALQVVDANFDGDPDLSISGYSGGAGPNNTVNFFLFNPSTRQFVFDQELSNLPQISIDPNTRTIHSAQRDGCCRHSTETYRYVHKTLTLIANWDESLSADGKWWETTNGRLKNGKWHYSTTRTKADLK